MKGFILGNGRSGTKWSAAALSRCTDLDARHESMRHTLGQDFGGVESNGNFWADADEIRRRYPGAMILHQVRDGRDVVRSILSCGDAGGSFQRACTRWARRNSQLVDDVPAAHRFRLEDLTADAEDFEAMAFLLGAARVDRGAWARMRRERVNARPKRFPPYGEWTAEQRDFFWRTCGEMMLVLGYVEEEEKL